MLKDVIMKAGLIPVVVLENAEDAEPLAGALCRGGLPYAEVTFRAEAAAESICRITRAYPEMVVGAGTVMTTDQVRQAMDAGATFIVTPGLNEPVMNYCIENGIPVVPGVMDTYAIEKAIAAGLDLLKFFPAEAAGGLKMLKALSGPYPKLRYMATGGINESNLADYLSDPRIAAVGGSWLCSAELVREGRFDEIGEKTRRAAELVRRYREDQ